MTKKIILDERTTMTIYEDGSAIIHHLPVQPVQYIELTYHLEKDFNSDTHD